MKKINLAVVYVVMKALFTMNAHQKKCKAAPIIQNLEGKLSDLNQKVVLFSSMRTQSEQQLMSENDELKTKLQNSNNTEKTLEIMSNLQKQIDGLKEIKENSRKKRKFDKLVSIYKSI